MHCPNDQTILAMTERQGIEIDYCPTCRGIWLDRGELDKLIEANNVAPKMPSHRDIDDRHQPQYSHQQGAYPYKKRKESFLGDLFDF